MFVRCGLKCFEGVMVGYRLFVLGVCGMVVLMVKDFLIIVGDVFVGYVCVCVLV